MHIVCPSCSTINRVKEDKSHLEAKCGKCDELVHTHQPAELTDETFFKYIQKNDYRCLLIIGQVGVGPVSKCYLYLQKLLVRLTKSFLPK